MQVTHAYDEESLVMRNNFNLVKMFLGQWRLVPLPLAELGQLISGAEPFLQPRAQAGEQQGSRGRQVLGLKLLAVGEYAPALPVMPMLCLRSCLNIIAA